MESAGIINEIWRTITGFVNYQISNIGRVRNADTGRILKPYDSRGYYRVRLSQDKVPLHKYVHRLVALEFLDNPDNKPIIDHIDGDTTSKCLATIRWVNQSENNMNTSIVCTWSFGQNRNLRT